jgi:hypothetical protein
MALMYAQLSDQEVLLDYQAVLAPSAVIAGPAALDLKSGVLPDEAGHWLKANFFKTELELGHCLRMPAEGPLRVRPLPDEWINGDAERLAWALRAVLAPAQAAPAIGWRGDMRHLPPVGNSPTSLAGGFTALRLSGAGRVRIVPRTRLVP